MLSTVEWMAIPRLISAVFFPKDDNLGIYVENARRERGRASEGGGGGVPGGICYARSRASKTRPPPGAWSRPLRTNNI